MDFKPGMFWALVLHVTFQAWLLCGAPLTPRTLRIGSNNDASRHKQAVNITGRARLPGPRTLLCHSSCVSFLTCKVGSWLSLTRRVILMLTWGLVSACSRPIPPIDTDCIYTMMEPALSQKLLAVSLQVPFTLFRVIL